MIDVSTVQYGDWNQADPHGARLQGGDCRTRAAVGREVGTVRGDRLEVLATLIEVYEEREFPFDTRQTR